LVDTRPKAAATDQTHSGYYSVLKGERRICREYRTDDERQNEKASRSANDGRAVDSTVQKKGLSAQEAHWHNPNQADKLKDLFGLIVQRWRENEAEKPEGQEYNEERFDSSRYALCPRHGALRQLST
jgi:hypothetical protein